MLDFYLLFFITMKHYYPSKDQMPSSAKTFPTMRKDKYLLIFGLLCTLAWIGGVVLSESWVFFRIILNIWIVLIINGLIVKYKLDYGKVQTDERTIKIAHKAIAFSRYLTLILTAILLVFTHFESIHITLYQALSIIFTTMTITYLGGRWYFKNKNM
jgi:hypothetical protein